MKRHRQNRQRGASLIEVLVGLAVFLLLSISFFSTFVGMKAHLLYQEEYIRFEMICRDIDAYYDAYGADWDKKYFDSGSLDGTVYFDASFQPSFQENTYRLTYGTREGALVVNVYHHQTDRVIIENLDYGEVNAGE